MDIHATYTFDAPVQTVWDLLMDTERVAACIPGCDRLEPLGDNRYRARLTVALAAVSGAFDGTVAMLDQQPPASYRLVVDGKGPGGFVTGESRIALSDRAHPRISLPFPPWIRPGLEWRIRPGPSRGRDSSE